MQKNEYSLLSAIGTTLQYTLSTALMFNIAGHIMPTVYRIVCDSKIPEKEENKNKFINAGIVIGIVPAMFINHGLVSDYINCFREENGIVYVPVITNCLSGIYELIRDNNLEQKLNK